MDVTNSGIMDAKSKLINEILQVCKVNDVPTTGDLFFSLAFRTEGELRGMASDLNINTSKI